MNMPKLLIINVSLNCGSTGRIAEQVGLLAQSRGWNVMIAHQNVVADGVETILEMDENQDLQEVETTRKYIENGILIIERGGVRYTAQGNKID